MKVPNGWQVMRMEDAGEIDGGRQRSPHLTDGEMRPYLRVANVMDGYIDVSDVKQMKFTHSEFKKFKLLAGDILLNEGQSLELCGRPALYRGVPPDCCFQNTIIRFRPRSETHGNFALQLFKYLLASGRFASIASKTTSIAHLGLSRFAALKAAFPPSEEQPKIASILETCDRGIESQQALLKAKTERKHGLMQQLLTGKNRFKQFAGKKWIRCALGEVVQSVSRPVVWNESELYRLASVRRNSGGVFSRDDLFGHQIKVKKLQTIRRGDFLISHIQAAYGAMALVPDEFDGAMVSELYTILRPKDPKAFDIRFLAYLGQTKRMWYMAIQASNGFFAERLRLNFDPEEFLQLPVDVPPTLEEQLKILDVLSACDREIKLLDRQLDALKEQKRGLMEQLLTGEVRVKL